MYQMILLLDRLFDIIVVLDKLLANRLPGKENRKIFTWMKW